MENDYNLLGILKMLSKWKKHIIIATILTAIATAAVSLMLPNYYMSNTVFYAANPLLANPTPLGGENITASIYGSDDDLDRIFTIANSNIIYDHLIKKFNLAEHYDIDDSTPKGQTKVYEKLNKLYNTTKTKYSALDLAVEDTDPKMARDIVHEARVKIDAVAQELIKSSHHKTIITKQEAVKNYQTALNTVIDTIKKVKREFQIFDPATQGAIYAEEVTTTETSLGQKSAQLRLMKQLGAPQDSINKVKAVIAGLDFKQGDLSEKVNRYNQGIYVLNQLEEEQKRINYELSLEKERLKKLQSVYGSDINSIHVVQEASVPTSKSRPRRSILVIALTGLAFVISSLLAIFIESTRHINWKEIYASSR